MTQTQQPLCVCGLKFEHHFNEETGQTYPAVGNGCLGYRPAEERGEQADPADLDFAKMILERCLEDGVFTDYEKTALRTVLKRLDGLEGALALAVETSNKLGAML